MFHDNKSHILIKQLHLILSNATATVYPTKLLKIPFSVPKPEPSTTYSGPEIHELRSR